MSTTEAPSLQSNSYIRPALPCLSFDSHARAHANKSLGPEHLILNRPAAKPKPEPVPLDLSPHSRLISFSPKITCQSTSRHYLRHLSQTRSCAADRPTCSLQSRYPIPPVVSGGARNCTSLPLELISSIQPTCSPSVVSLSFEFPASASENSFLFIVVACQLTKNNNPSPYVPTLFLSKTYPNISPDAHWTHPRRIKQA
ncbi:putative membrane protein [Fusarium oxysporum f. sp. albedinis]|nr:putative membrane protein [Fusarium oxysporum f. sp. albedinis]